MDTSRAMERFRSRVVKSAAAAATAARELTALDEMAENDAYVQSEGLNVSGARRGVVTADSYTHGSSTQTVSSSIPAIGRDDRPSAPSLRRPSEESEHSAGRSPCNGTAAAAAVPPSRSAPPSRDPLQTGSPASPPEEVSKYPMLISSVAALYDGREKDIERRAKATVERRGSSPSARPHGQQQQQQQARVLLVNQRHAQILHQLDFHSDDDSSSGSSDGDNDNDEEKCRREINEGSDGGDGRQQFGGHRPALPRSEQLERELEESLKFRNEGCVGTNGSDQRARDPNRFLKMMTSDLEIERRALLSDSGAGEGRDAAPPLGSSSSGNAGNASAASHPVQKSATPSQVGGIDANKQVANAAIEASLSWMRNVATPKFQALSKQVRAKLSEGEILSKPRGDEGNVDGAANAGESAAAIGGPMIGPRHPVASPKGADEESFTVTNSAAFFAEDDRAELERIRIRNSSSAITRAVYAALDTLRKNQRLTFVLATLIFALLAYYYSTKRSVDDVL